MTTQYSIATLSKSIAFNKNYAMIKMNLTILAQSLLIRHTIKGA